MPTLTHPKLTPAVIDLFLDMYATDKRAARRYLGEELGVGKTQMYDWAVKIAQEHGLYGRPAASAPSRLDAAQGELDLNLVTPNVQSLDEVVDLCQVDRTAWDVKSFAVNQRKAGFGWRVSFARSAASLVSGPNLDALVSEIAASRPDWSATVKQAKPKAADHLFMLGVPDLHIGKLAQAEETGWDNYDVKIAVECFRTAVRDLLSRIDPTKVGRVLFPIGNDLLHVDSQLNQTTGGTPQDVDGRIHKLFQTAVSLMAETIEAIAADYPVDVVVVRSNHDYNTVFYIGEVLRAQFTGHPNVTINNAPTARKYYRFGATLLGFTHGDKEKADSLPLIMATEAKEDWAKTDQRFFLCGHVHREIVREYNGVKVVYMPSLSASDSWHASQAFCGSKRAAVGLVFHQSDGLITQHYHTIKN